MFVASTGLVAYAYSGVEARVGVTAGRARPRVVGGEDTLWDAHSPKQARAIIAEKLAEGGEVLQQQKIATSCGENSQ